MKKLAAYSVVVTALLIGNTLPRHWFVPSAEAAPADVFGSPNVAVDTYRNVKGTYVLWADGRITNANGGSADLGRPYTTPDASAQIGTPSLSQGRPLGSPNVAVKAIPRKDATYILFSDGVIKKPANADAAAGEAGGGRVISGTYTHASGVSAPDFSYTPGTTGNDVIQLTDPVGSNSHAFAVGYMDVAGGGAMAGQKSCIPVEGVVSGDGRSVSFNFAAAPGTLPSFGVIYTFIIVDKQ